MKWFSHGGPDVVENGLSLCSLHHRAFDLGAIASSDDHKVPVSRDFRGGGEWEARFLRVSGAPLVGPQAGEPPVRGGVAAWHRKKVFRGRIVCSSRRLGAGRKSHPPESNRRPTDYERTQAVAGRFRRVAVSWKIRGLRVGADPAGGTGRHRHGDWMETDRCAGEAVTY